MIHPDKKVESTKEFDFHVAALERTGHGIGGFLPMNPGAKFLGKRDMAFGITPNILDVEKEEPPNLTKRKKTPKYVLTTKMISMFLPHQPFSYYKLCQQSVFLENAQQ